MEPMGRRSEMQAFPSCSAPWQYVMLRCYRTQREQLNSKTWNCGEIGDFLKIRGTLFWGPYNKDPTIYRVLY